MARDGAFGSGVVNGTIICARFNECMHASTMHRQCIETKMLNYEASEMHA
jgi:hypothetical protein